jgi:hypothetical protein
VKVQTFQYRPADGFSPALTSDLDSKRTLVLVFGAPGLERTPDLFVTLKAAFPEGLVFGCSTAGEIADTHLADDSLSVAVVQFSSTAVRLATANVPRVEDSYEAAHTLARQLAGPGLRALLVLSDGLQVNGSELARGFRDALPAEVVVTGGLAADGPRFARTWVVSNDRVAQGLVAAVGLYGDHVRVGHGSQGGWDVFGSERVITRSRSNVLYELDGRPALDLY